MAEQSVYKVTLPLGHIGEFFAPTQIDPFSERFGEYSFTSGMEYIARELAGRPVPAAIEATLLLPPDQITPDLEARTRAAVQRYCRSRLAELGQTIRASRRRIRSTLIVAVLALFALNGAALLLSSSRLFFTDVIADGLIIAGWVLLWFPLDAIVATLNYERVQSSIYRHLMEMDLTLRAAPAEATAAGVAAQGGADDGGAGRAAGGAAAG